MLAQTIRNVDEASKAPGTLTEKVRAPFQDVRSSRLNGDRQVEVRKYYPSSCVWEAHVVGERLKLFRPS